MPTTKLFFSQLRLLHLPSPSSLTMKPPSSLLLSRPSRTFLPTFPFKFKHLALRNAPFRALSTRSDSTRRKQRPRLSSSSSPSANPKSLIDDEAELSDWVDKIRTKRVDSEFGESTRNPGQVRREPSSNSSFSRSSGFSQRRFGRELEEEDNGGFRTRKRRGVELNRGGGGKSLRRKPKPQLMSENDEDDDEVVVRKGFKGFLSEEDDEEEESDESEDDEIVRKGFKGFLSEEDDEEEESDESEDDEIVRKSRSALFGGTKQEQQPAPAARRASSPSGTDSYLSDTRFDQCSVSPLSLKGVKDAGYEKMTIVQAATLPVILKGKDVLAKARTGTGKTVAFLLPSIEVVANSPPTDRDHRRPPIHVLVICPTRELASQAAAEAGKLLKYHPTIGVQVVIGGTRLALEQKRMQANPCQILVATPGRLRDHVENTAGFATRLMGVKVLVLDEADHLLDMGFRKDIEKIIAAVPKQRQTLMFSATIPDEVRQVCHIALRRDHEFINTVQEGTEETHSQVRQTHLVAPLDKHFSLLYALLKEHIADDVDYKVLVFCTTAMVTRLVAELLGELNLNVREIHSRKPQSYRTRVSEEFRKSKGLILVTSDVSARGVDYPDVTLVVQVGLPADREQYIHRLGRTGRRGKEGQGILLLAPWEEFFLSTIKDLPIEKANIPSVDPDTKKKVEKALCHVEMKNKEAAYQAWLGYYNSNKKVGRDKYRLVELANEFSKCMMLDNPPAIPKLVLGKMGLRNIPGLRSK
ncbi:DEAD-box ATP-dependent RNA helicase 31 [Stylosanthes scabra]|uniref:ATP-dependent RNA helicase n=1 Tax=Stylosanthes scabra TaxID=79078 RepID=A0ABU6UMB5_9FABA|nr:DEAD-box ATP-dependent RNA helicase 31 [Stylosanthes scabra]